MTKKKAGKILRLPKPLCNCSGDFPRGDDMAWVVENRLARCPACYATLELVGGRLPDHEPSPSPSEAWREGIRLRVEGWRGEDASDAAWVKDGVRWLLKSKSGEDRIGWIGPAKHGGRGWLVRVEGVTFRPMSDGNPTYLGGARSKAEAAAIIRHARRIRGLST